MNIYLKKSNLVSNNLTITGSKSESNRLLLLQALFPDIQLRNVSNSDDSNLMTKALANMGDVIDIHHAGTAMRFLTAFLAIQTHREVVLTGSERMKERPIGILVEALKSLGADISYLENDGFPPLKIKGVQFKKSEVTLSADVSSQYISALLLIASTLKEGLKLNLEGKITSVPYIKMTLQLLNKIGVETSFEGNTIRVYPFNREIQSSNLVVESDWSSASYFYSIVALSDVGYKLKISSYMKDSLQGDSVLQDIYKNFGVKTSFLENNLVELEKISEEYKTQTLDLSNCPDIAQTIAVTALGLNLPCHLIGLHTLKIKETDRLEALKCEIEKFGAKVEIDNESLKLTPIKVLNSKVLVQTYKDHRMAMAFTPLAIITDLEIQDYLVVSKSYPDFWKDMASLGVLTKIK